jgi:ribosomal protein S18 acetylase RimI-like enzyme
MHNPLVASAFQIRPATMQDVPALAKLHVDTWRSTYQGLISADFLEQLTYELKEAQWKQGLRSSSTSAHRLVAEHEDAIAGFAIVGGKPSDAWPQTSEMYALYVSSDAKGRGIGSKLFLASAEWLRAKGHNSMLIRVLKGNQLAIGFYESRGAVLIGEDSVEIGDRVYPELIYALALTENPSRPQD